MLNINLYHSVHLHPTRVDVALRPVLGEIGDFEAEKVFHAAIDVKYVLLKYSYMLGWFAYRSDAGIYNYSSLTVDLGMLSINWYHIVHIHPTRVALRSVLQEIGDLEDEKVFHVQGGEVGVPEAERHSVYKMFSDWTAQSLHWHQDRHDCDMDASEAEEHTKQPNKQVNSSGLIGTQ